jgi:hypothetical protein
LNPAFWKLAVGFQVIRVVAVHGPKSGRSSSTMFCIGPCAPLSDPAKMSPGRDWIVRLPPPTIRSLGTSRTTLHRLRSSAVPVKSSSPGQPAIGGKASILTVAVRERPPASLTFSVAVWTPTVEYVCAASFVVASTVPSLWKSHS